MVLRVLDLPQRVEGALAVAGHVGALGCGRRGVPDGLAHGSELCIGHRARRPDDAVPGCYLLRWASLVGLEGHNCRAAPPKPGVFGRDACAPRAI
eukprot:1871496-Pyramimonas_sp.AAC.1